MKPTSWYLDDHAGIEVTFLVECRLQPCHQRRFKWIAKLIGEGHLGSPQPMFGGKTTAIFICQLPQPKREGFFPTEEPFLPDWRRQIVVNAPIAQMAERVDPNAVENGLAYLKGAFEEICEKLRLHGQIVL